MMDYIESDMNFTPLFSLKQFRSFYLEKSPLYTALSPHGVKTVEFITAKGNQLYFIECKQEVKVISEERARTWKLIQ